MALNSIETYLLAGRLELRQRVEMLGLVVASEIVSENIATLLGGIDEHNSRFLLAHKAISPDSNLITTATKGVVANLRNVLDIPTELVVGEPLDSKISRLALSIPDESILTALRVNWTFASGFDLNAHLFNNP